MRGMFKRIYAGILISAFCVTGASAINVDKGNSDKSFHYTVNEYELLKQLNEELHDTKTRSNALSGLTADKIVEIEDYREKYIEKVVELQALSDQELENVKYTDDQIDAIRSFDVQNPQEELLLRAASTCTVNGDFTSYTHSSSGTTAKFVAEFHWNGIQSNWFNDIFAITWSAPLNATSLSGYVQYLSTYGNYKTVNHTPRPNSTYGSYIEFPKYGGVGSSGNEAYYVNAGSIIGTLHSNTDVKDITAYAAYGYNSIAVSPSVSISPSGASGSISFSIGMSIAGSTRFYR